jgi:hypothetical protein
MEVKHNKSKSIKLIINIVSILGMVWGFSCFFLSSFFSDFPDRYNVELPLSNAKGIIVSSDGRIFVGLQLYSIIQVYDKNGKFIENWKVGSEGGAFCLDIDEDDVINVYIFRRNLKQSFETNGKLKSSLVNISIEDSIINNQNSFFQKGDRYKIYNSSISPKIKKNGKVIIEQGFLLKSLTYPFGMAYGFLSLLVFLIFNRNLVFNIFKK